MKHRLLPKYCERYHGNESTRPYFEGWYFKHVLPSGEMALAVICGVSRAKNKRDDHSFIQIITGPEHEAHYIRYAYNAFYYDKDRFFVSIGNSTFSLDGIHLDIDRKDLKLNADLQYSNHVSLENGFLSPSIMGPFSYIPNLECNHGVLSMKNSVDGNVTLNGKTYDMQTALGYIEKDWGEAFPDSWVWLQGNVSKSGGEVSFMFSVAKVPFAGLKFTGLICVLDFAGKQYRFATYNGTKIEFIKKTENGVSISIKKGKYRLKINAYSDGYESLVAPTRNGMERELFESISGDIELELSKDNAPIVEKHLVMCGIEVSEIEEY